MKKNTVILVTLAVLFSIASCGGNAEIATATGDLSSASAENHIDETDVTTVQTEERNLSPIELLDYIVEENGIYLNPKGWTELEDYTLLRKYFFGVWDNEFGVNGVYGEGDFSLLIFDDSEKSFFQVQQIFHFRRVYEISSDTLALMISSESEVQLFWLDKNNPDTLYMKWLVLCPNEMLEFYGCDSAEEIKPVILTKTDTSPNEPEENFLSIFKLHEISRDHGIDFDLLTNIDYGMIDGTYYLHSATYDFYPMYLVSESNDKIVIRTTVGNVVETGLELIDIICTFEKTDDEWNRTIEEV